MQLLFDFIPLIAFFIAYRLFDLYVATATLMVAMVVVVAHQWLRHRKVGGILLGSTVLVLVFGGITLALHNPVFIQWKVTVVNWTVAIVFLASQLFGSKTITERTMGDAIELAPVHWRYLNTIWVVTFAATGAINLFVMYNYDQATWVLFKVWGQIGLFLLGGIGNFIWLWMYMPQGETDKSG